MRATLIIHVSVLVLCSSLSFWAGLRQGQGNVIVAPGEREKKPRRMKPENTQAALEPASAPGNREEALALLKSIYTKGMENEVAEGHDPEALFLDYAQKNPSSAWEVLLEQGITAENSHLCDAVLAMIAETEPRKAHGLALTLSDPRLRQEALSVVLDNWAMTDPQAALAAALEMAETRKPHQISSLAAQWARENPQEVAAFAQAQPHGAARRAMLGGLGQAWLGADVAGFCGWFKSLPDRDVRTVLQQLNRGGVELPDGKAMGLADIKMVWETLPPGDHRTEAAKELFAHMDFSTPEKGAALLAEVSALPDVETARSMRRMVLEGMMRANPEAAAAEYLRASVDERRMLLGELGLAEALFESDRALAENWVRSLPQGPERIQGLAQLTRSLAESDGDAALAFFLASPELHESKEATQVLTRFAYLEVQPEGLFQAVSVLPKNEQPVALEEISRRIAEEDPHVCVDLIEKMTAGNERDAAVRGLVQSLHEEPESALVWALTISDSEQRQGMVEDALRNWTKEGREAWLAKNPGVLPPDVVKRLSRPDRNFDGFSSPEE